MDPTFNYDDDQEDASLVMYLNQLSTASSRTHHRIGVNPFDMKFDEDDDNDENVKSPDFIKNHTDIDSFDPLVALAQLSQFSQDKNDLNKNRFYHAHKRKSLQTTRITHPYTHIPVDYDVYQLISRSFMFSHHNAMTIQCVDDRTHEQFMSSILSLFHCYQPRDIYELLSFIQNELISEETLNASGKNKDDTNRPNNSFNIPHFNENPFLDPYNTSQSHPKYIADLIFRVFLSTLAPPRSICSETLTKSTIAAPIAPVKQSSHLKPYIIGQNDQTIPKIPEKAKNNTNSAKNLLNSFPVLNTPSKLQQYHVPHIMSSLKKQSTPKKTPQNPSGDDYLSHSTQTPVKKHYIARQPSLDASISINNASFITQENIIDIFTSMFPILLKQPFFRKSNTIYNELDHFNMLYHLIKSTKENLKDYNSLDIDLDENNENNENLQDNNSHLTMLGSSLEMLFSSLVSPCCMCQTSLLYHNSSNMSSFYRSLCPEKPKKCDKKLDGNNDIIPSYSIKDHIFSDKNLTFYDRYTTPQQLLSSLQNSDNNESHKNSPQSIKTDQKSLFDETYEGDNDVNSIKNTRHKPNIPNINVDQDGIKTQSFDPLLPPPSFVHLPPPTNNQEYDNITIIPGDPVELSSIYTDYNQFASQLRPKRGNVSENLKLPWDTPLIAMACGHLVHKSCVELELSDKKKEQSDNNQTEAEIFCMKCHENTRFFPLFNYSMYDLVWAVLISTPPDLFTNVNDFLVDNSSSQSLFGISQDLSSFSSFSVDVFPHKNKGPRWFLGENRPVGYWIIRYFLKSMMFSKITEIYISNSITQCTNVPLYSNNVILKQYIAQHEQFKKNYSHFPNIFGQLDSHPGFFYYNAMIYHPDKNKLLPHLAVCLPYVQEKIISDYFISTKELHYNYVGHFQRETEKNLTNGHVMRSEVWDTDPFLMKQYVSEALKVFSDENTKKKSKKHSTLEEKKQVTVILDYPLFFEKFLEELRTVRVNLQNLTSSQRESIITEMGTNFLEKHKNNDKNILCLNKDPFSSLNINGNSNDFLLPLHLPRHVSSPEQTQQSLAVSNNLYDPMNSIPIYQIFLLLTLYQYHNMVFSEYINHNKRQSAKKNHQNSQEPVNVHEDKDTFALVAEIREQRRMMLQNTAEIQLLSKAMDNAKVSLSPLFQELLQLYMVCTTLSAYYSQFHYETYAVRGASCVNHLYDNIPIPRLILSADLNPALSQLDQLDDMFSAAVGQTVGGKPRVNVSITGGKTKNRISIITMKAGRNRVRTTETDLYDITNHNITPKNTSLIAKTRSVPTQNSYKQDGILSYAEAQNTNPLTILAKKRTQASEMWLHFPEGSKFYVEFPSLREPVLCRKGDDRKVYFYPALHNTASLQYGLYKTTFPALFSFIFHITSPKNGFSAEKRKYLLQSFLSSSYLHYNRLFYPLFLIDNTNQVATTLENIQLPLFVGAIHQLMVSYINSFKSSSTINGPLCAQKHSSDCIQRILYSHLAAPSLNEKVKEKQQELLEKAFIYPTRETSWISTSISGNGGLNLNYIPPLISQLFFSLLPTEIDMCDNEGDNLQNLSHKSSKEGRHFMDFDFSQQVQSLSQLQSSQPQQQHRNGLKISEGSESDEENNLAPTPAPSLLVSLTLLLLHTLVHYRVILIVLHNNSNFTEFIAYLRYNAAIFMQRQLKSLSIPRSTENIEQSQKLAGYFEISYDSVVLYFLLGSDRNPLVYNMYTYDQLETQLQVLTKQITQLALQILLIKSKFDITNIFNGHNQFLWLDPDSHPEQQFRLACETSTATPHTSEQPTQGNAGLLMNKWSSYSPKMDNKDGTSEFLSSQHNRIAQSDDNPFTTRDVKKCPSTAIKQSLFTKKTTGSTSVLKSAHCTPVRTQNGGLIKNKLNSPINHTPLKLRPFETNIIRYQSQYELQKQQELDELNELEMMLNNSKYLELFSPHRLKKTPRKSGNSRYFSSSPAPGKPAISFQKDHMDNFKSKNDKNALVEVDDDLNNALMFNDDVDVQDILDPANFEMKMAIYQKYFDEQQTIAKNIIYGKTGVDCMLYQIYLHNAIMLVHSPTTLCSDNNIIRCFLDRKLADTPLQTISQEHNDSFAFAQTIIPPINPTANIFRAKDLRTIYSLQNIFKHRYSDITTRFMRQFDKKTFRAGDGDIFNNELKSKYKDKHFPIMTQTIFDTFPYLNETESTFMRLYDIKNTDTSNTLISVINYGDFASKQPKQRSLNKISEDSFSLYESLFSHMGEDGSYQGETQTDQNDVHLENEDHHGDKLILTASNEADIIANYQDHRLMVVFTEVIDNSSKLIPQSNQKSRKNTLTQHKSKLSQAIIIDSDEEDLFSTLNNDENQCSDNDNTSTDQTYCTAPINFHDDHDFDELFSDYDERRSNRRSAKQSENSHPRSNMIPTRQLTHYILPVDLLSDLDLAVNYSFVGELLQRSYELLNMKLKKQTKSADSFNTERSDDSIGDNLQLFKGDQYFDKIYQSRRDLQLIMTEIYNTLSLETNDYPAFITNSRAELQNIAFTTTPSSLSSPLPVIKRDNQHNMSDDNYTQQPSTIPPFDDDSPQCIDFEILYSQQNLLKQWYFYTSPHFLNSTSLLPTHLPLTNQPYFKPSTPASVGLYFPKVVKSSYDVISVANVKYLCDTQTFQVLNRLINVNIDDLLLIPYNHPNGQYLRNAEFTTNMMAINDTFAHSDSSRYGYLNNIKLLLVDIEAYCYEKTSHSNNTQNNTTKTQLSVTAKIAILNYLIRKLIVSHDLDINTAPPTASSVITQFNGRVNLNYYYNVLLCYFQKQNVSEDIYNQIQYDIFLSLKYDEILVRYNKKKAEESQHLNKKNSISSFCDEDNSFLDDAATYSYLKQIIEKLVAYTCNVDQDNATQNAIVNDALSLHNQFCCFVFYKPLYNTAHCKHASYSELLSNNISNPPISSPQQTFQRMLINTKTSLITHPYYNDISSVQYISGKETIQSFKSFISFNHRESIKALEMNLPSFSDITTTTLLNPIITNLTLISHSMMPSFSVISPQVAIDYFDSHFKLINTRLSSINASLSDALSAQFNILDGIHDQFLRRFNYTNYNIIQQYVENFIQKSNQYEKKGEGKLKWNLKKYPKIYQYIQLPHYKIDINTQFVSNYTINDFYTKLFAIISTISHKFNDFSENKNHITVDYDEEDIENIAFITDPHLLEIAVKSAFTSAINAISSIIQKKSKHCQQSQYYNNDDDYSAVDIQLLNISNSFIQKMLLPQYPSHYEEAMYQHHLFQPIIQMLQSHYNTINLELQNCRKQSNSKRFEFPEEYDIVNEHFDMNYNLRNASIMDLVKKIQHFRQGNEVEKVNSLNQLNIKLQLDINTSIDQIESLLVDVYGDNEDMIIMRLEQIEALFASEKNIDLRFLLDDIQSKYEMDLLLDDVNSHKDALKLRQMSTLNQMVQAPQVSSGNELMKQLFNPFTGKKMRQVDQKNQSQYQQPQYSQFGDPRIDDQQKPQESMLTRKFHQKLLSDHNTIMQQQHIQQKNGDHEEHTQKEHQLLQRLFRSQKPIKPSNPSCDQDQFLISKSSRTFTNINAPFNNNQTKNSTSLQSDDEGNNSHDTCDNPFFKQSIPNAAISQPFGRKAKNDNDPFSGSSLNLKMNGKPSVISLPSSNGFSENTKAKIGINPLQTNSVSSAPNPFRDNPCATVTSQTFPIKPKKDIMSLFATNNNCDSSASNYLDSGFGIDNNPLVEYNSIDSSSRKSKRGGNRKKTHAPSIAKKDADPSMLSVSGLRDYEERQRVKRQDKTYTISQPLAKPQPPQKPAQISKLGLLLNQTKKTRESQVDIRYGGDYDDHDDGNDDDDIVDVVSIKKSTLPSASTRKISKVNKQPGDDHDIICISD